MTAKNIRTIVGNLYLLSIRIINRIKMIILKPCFKNCGSNVVFDPNGKYSFKTISIGSDVFIGSGANFAASESSIKIGSKVMFGPNVTIMGGDHNTSEIGKYMFDVKSKLPENDMPVVIGDDVWVGTRVIILKGVTIGEGSIIGAGSLVTKSCPPYSILIGVPAKIHKLRFTEAQLKKHKSILSSA